MQRSSKNTPRRELTTYHQSRAVRLPDFGYTGDVNVHLTVCAAGDVALKDDQLAAVICQSIENACELRRYRLLGYCLMPDHLHVLLSPARSDKPVGDWLRDFKSYTTNRFMRRGGKPPLWQRSAHDRVCRSEETAEAILAYIIENPVRTGLVDRWQDWPWTKVFIEL